MKHKSRKKFEKELMEHIKLNNYYKNISPEERRAIMRAYFEKYEYEKEKKLN
jgi:ABC-type transporter MlaC component